MSRILFINSVCNGSTGMICKNLYKVAVEAGHECCIAYGRGEAPEGFNTIKIGNQLDIYLHVLKARMFDASGFGSKHATKEFIKRIEEFKPDIIHLHNIHGYYVNIEILFKYLKEHPEIKKIWTLHDCWAFTGHCPHFEYDKCMQWKTGCKKCVRTKKYPRSLVDKCNRNYQLKKKIFTDVNNLILVSPSNWLMNLVKKSFLSNYEIQTIKNGINIDIFNQSNEKINTSIDLNNKKIILGVASIWDDSKGLNEFIELSKKITNDYIIILIGKLNNKHIKQFNNIYNVSNINDSRELAKWYLAAYVFFNPTKGEAFGLTNYEAQACGTPVVTFDAGGTSETIINKNSFLIKGLNEFEQLIKNTAFYKLNLCVEERNCFSIHNTIKKYLDNYKEDNQ
ncbi:glycosyltransferase [Thomasclavelia cocleata]|uniref:glycosyltransferase n=3 Tax=Thomasclavelia cocleata TaxID=69824 RepID=UPI00243094D9|nr:glycosyltransferase [Thomasclavelia cocleata]